MGIYGGWWQEILKCSNVYQRCAENIQCISNKNLVCKFERQVDIKFKNTWPLLWNLSSKQGKRPILKKKKPVNKMFPCWFFLPFTGDDCLVMDHAVKPSAMFHAMF